MSSLQFHSAHALSGEKPKQLVVLLHGYGADGEDLISLAGEFNEIIPDAAFVAPDGPYKSEAGGSRQWFSLQEYNDPYMFRGLQQVEPILNNFIQEQLKKHHLTIQNLFLIGFSQGAMLALHTGPRLLENCGGIISLSGALVMPEILVKEVKSKPPILLLHGADDAVVDCQRSLKAEQFLKATGLDVECHVIPRLGHSISQPELAMARKFIKILT